jgi:hypothetical protein
MRILNDVLNSFFAGCRQSIEDQRRIFRAVASLFKEKPPRP